MKGIKTVLAITLVFMALTGCEMKEVHIVKKYEPTDSSLYGNYFEKGELVICKQYYELSDGTYKTEDGNVYKYRLEITGRMHSASRDSIFVILSNRDDITFDEAWKAAGFSSNSEDYFSPAEAVIVGRG